MGSESPEDYAAICRVAAAHLDRYELGMHGCYVCVWKVIGDEVRYRAPRPGRGVYYDLKSAKTYALREANRRKTSHAYVVEREAGAAGRYLVRRATQWGCGCWEGHGQWTSVRYTSDLPRHVESGVRFRPSALAAVERAA